MARCWTEAAHWRRTSIREYFCESLLFGESFSLWGSLICRWYSSNKMEQTVLLSTQCCMCHCWSSEAKPSFKLVVLIVYSKLNCNICTAISLTIHTSPVLHRFKQLVFSTHGDSKWAVRVHWRAFNYTVCYTTNAEWVHPLLIYQQTHFASYVSYLSTQLF